MTSSEFPGYRLDRLVGVGPVGEAWAAVETATGASRLLRRLRPAVAGRAAERLLTADASDGCFVAMRGLVSCGREVALVTDLAAGGSLRAAGPQSLAWFTSLALDLAGLHAGGTVHGALTPANVLVGADGLLLDLDVTRLLGALDGTAHRSPYADGPAGLAGDVRGFALLCRRYASGAPRQVLRAAAEAPAAERPTMAEVADVLAAVPVLVSPLAVSSDQRVEEPKGEPEQFAVAELAVTDGPRAGWARRWPAVALLVVVAVVGAALGLVAGRGRPPTEPARLSAGRSVGPDWPAVVSGLVVKRAAAIRRLDPTALAAVYVTDAGQRAVDVATVQRLRAAGASAVSGYATSVLGVEAGVIEPGQVTLTVTDALSAYDVMAADGRVLQHAGPRPARDWTVVLRREAGAWRLWSVQPV